ncbi:hypothetical protein TRFO_09305 [Tritrichomonas foetus]|uniref:Inositol-pentakisphosphate 2-kinase n=1 Tax=Tritrichomonas foetus TaxID=1144522 RepID=A0A1J4JK30_9EUKA|nr:hypothetical protein TRFO_09305 [Tritrichomonas foetus]|eukprot:OHS97612.1 hypothetical protein TRFO_09305 [Tritrichomonas foetus]
MSNFPQLKCLDPACWDYKAEGFDSIILTWVGPSNSEFNLKALRLFKNHNEGFRRGNSQPLTDFTDRVVILDKYINSFIRPHLPEVDAGTPVRVTQQFLEDIERKITPKRPESRIKESTICITSQVAILHDDHIPPNSLVIEIKPKWGFLPDCPIIDSSSPKLTVSRFQLMQRQKLKKGEISAFTKYDPIDLFSGDENRVDKAIRSLVENPQGNLKVFRDKNSSKLQENEIKKLVKVLNEHPALKKLLVMQKLDVWDIECIPPIIEKADNPTWENLINDEAVINGVNSMFGTYHLPPSKSEVIELRDNLTKQEARIFIAAFCVSQAAKDCSFMITFKNRTTIGNETEAEEPEIFIIDFDMKMPELLLSNYLKNDQKIIEIYKEMEKC